jgi:hypothetical protein
VAALYRQAAHWERAFTADERRKHAKSGAAMPDGSFPILNRTHLHAALTLYGHAKDPAAAKRHIIKRAKAIGATGMLPEGWTSS